MKHPKVDEKGRAVRLHSPHACTPMATWQDRTALATAIPGCELPLGLNDIPFGIWSDVPQSAAAWEELAGAFQEPAFAPAPGRKTASGAVVVERDGRVWMVSPSNAFGGYVTTFPKGTFTGEDGTSLRANAVKEVHEETGLKVRLTGFLCDCDRGTSRTRYYLAERLGGTPADMGWESQAVHLVPRLQLAAVASHPNDRAILQALHKSWR